MCHLTRKLQVLCDEMARDPDIPYSKKNWKTVESMKERWKGRFLLILMLLLFICGFMVTQDLLDPCAGTFEGYFPNKLLSD